MTTEISLPLGSPLVLKADSVRFLETVDLLILNVLAAAPEFAWVRITAEDRANSDESADRITVSYGTMVGALPERSDAFAAAAWRLERHVIERMPEWMTLANRVSVRTPAFDAFFTRTRVFVRDVEIITEHSTRPVIRAISSQDSAHQRAKDILDYAHFKETAGYEAVLGFRSHPHSELELKPTDLRLLR